MKEEIKTLVTKCQKQIEDDRIIIQRLFDNLSETLDTCQSETERQAWHLNYGLIASKYFELLNKTNEQLLKLIVLYENDESTTEEEYTRLLEDLEENANEMVNIASF